MAEYNWPEASKRSLIGKRISRLDGPEKVSGKAKYTYDLKRPGMLYGKMVRCPHAHAKVSSIDTSAAEKMPGVKAVKIIQDPGSEIQWAGDGVVVVAATEEHLAEDAARAVKVTYEVLPHLVREEDLSKAGDRAKPAAEKVAGDPTKAFSEAEVVSEGTYSIAVITHCCLESHGQITEWEGDKLNVFPSTQAVTGIGGEFVKALGIPATNVRVRMNHVGGGFGSKFNADRWGIEGARLAKLAGQPVKIMLERDAELMVAGGRPSSFAKIKMGRHASASVRLADTQPAYEPYRRGNKHRACAGLAGAEPSAGLLPHHVRNRGSGRGAQDGSAGDMPEEHKSPWTPRLAVPGGAPQRGGDHRVEKEMASPGRHHRRPHQEGARPLDAHLGRSPTQ